MKAQKNKGQPENDNVDNAVDQVLALVSRLEDPEDMSPAEARSFYQAIIDDLIVRLDAL